MIVAVAMRFSLTPTLPRLRERVTLVSLTRRQRQRASRQPEIEVEQIGHFGNGGGAALVLPGGEPHR